MKRRFLSRWLFLLVSALLLVAAIGWIVRQVGVSRLVAARKRFEAEAGSLSLADYVLPVVDEDQNAAVWLRAGAESLRIPEGATEVMWEILGTESRKWSPESLLAATELIEANIEVFDSLERTMGLEASSLSVPYERGFDADTTPMLELYRLGRWVAFDHRLALAAGDIDRAARDLEILDQISAALARESFVVSALMQLAVEQLFLGALRDVIEIAGADSELLRKLQTRLGERDSAEVLRRAIAGEAAAILDAAKNDASSAEPTRRDERLRLWLLEPYQLAGLLDSFGGVVRSLETPWIETLQRRQAKDQDESWTITRILLPNLFAAVDKLKAVELSRGLATEALALALAGSQSGELPASLESRIADPYASGSVVYEVSAQGGASLTAPEALELWTSQHGIHRDRPGPVFSFRLGVPGV